MEKLQKALQKARDQRTTLTEPSGSAREISSLAPEPENLMSAQGADAAWSSLAERRLDQKLLDRNLIVSAEAASSATPFDILRTKSRLLMQKNGWTRLGITSPTAACGKTTTALNLALGFTRQSDLRVILVELDLRKPSIAKILGHMPPRDISEMLQGQVPFSEQALKIRDNLALSMAQKAARDPTSLMLSQKTHATLTEIEQTYEPDILIFDLPPVLVSDDTRAFLKDLDCAMIIAKAETTSVAQIDACEREVSELTNVLGIVLNQCRHVGDTDYGYESYGYGA